MAFGNLCLRYWAGFFLKKLEADQVIKKLNRSNSTQSPILISVLDQIYLLHSLTSKLYVQPIFHVGTPSMVFCFECSCVYSWIFITFLAFCKSCDNAGSQESTEKLISFSIHGTVRLPDYQILWIITWHLYWSKLFQVIFCYYPCTWTAERMRRVFH